METVLINFIWTSLRWEFTVLRTSGTKLSCVKYICPRSWRDRIFPSIFSYWGSSVRDTLRGVLKFQFRLYNTQLTLKDLAMSSISPTTGPCSVTTVIGAEPARQHTKSRAKSPVKWMTFIGLLCTKKNKTNKNFSRDFYFYTRQQMQVLITDNIAFLVYTYMFLPFLVIGLLEPRV